MPLVDPHDGAGQGVGEGARGVLEDRQEVLMGCVYLLTFPNGKKYVGKSKYAAEKRFEAHWRCRSGRSALSRALRKHGRRSVVVKTLLTSDEDKELCRMEVFYISFFGTRAPHGYNLTEGGEGIVGLSVEAENRRRRNISRGLTGKKLSASHVQNLRRSHLGQTSPMEGRQHSESTRRKMSASARKRWRRDREKIMEYRKSLEFHQNMSHAQKKAWVKRRES